MPAIPNSRTKTIVAWSLQILVAATFLAAGIMKLIGLQMMVEIFDHIGFGQWFRYVTGTVEIIGGLLLLLPATVVFGAALLSATMACAVLTHLVLIGGSPVPALVLLVLDLVILWLRRREVSELIGKANPA